MIFFRRKPVVPVVRLAGTIGMGAPLRSGLTLAGVAGALERAFTMSRLPTVAIVVNSPGGSPVQSSLIFRRIRQLADEHGKRVYAFAEDVAASGGYYIAVAGDEIYADPSSVLGSIGVISAGFGFDKAIEKIGVERRVHTAGRSKATLDPFSPEKPEDVERLKAVQRDIHDAFIAVVKERRGARLKGTDDELFSGAFWSGRKSVEIGLADGIADLRATMRGLHGKDVQLRMVSTETGGWLSRRLRRVPLTQANPVVAGLAEEALAALEERQLWSRFGL